jgi:syntaxin 1B/2/3
LLTAYEQYGYGGRPNPYDQRGPAPGGGGYGQARPYNPPAGPYTSQPYDNAPPAYGGAGYSTQPTIAHDPYGSNVEMQPLAPNASSMSRAGADPNAILDECRDIYAGIDAIEALFTELKRVQQRSLHEADSSTSSGGGRSNEVDALNSRIIAEFATLTKRVKGIRALRESTSPRNAPQVRNVQERLKRTRQMYLTLESEYERSLKADMARQYKIVRPQASEAEVREAVDDTSGGQIFSQALMQSSRRGQASSALHAVESRHQAIQKIERQMIELAQLFTDMEALVVQQEEAVALIEGKGEEVVVNLDRGNEELGKGVKSARAARRKKWWCLLICGELESLLCKKRFSEWGANEMAVIIILIVVVVVIIYFKVINPPKSKKRSIDAAASFSVKALEVAAWMPRGGRSVREGIWGSLT